MIIGLKTKTGLAILLIMLVLAVIFIARINSCFDLSPQIHLTDCYFAGNEADGAALAEYGAKQVPFDSLKNLPNEICIILDGQSADLDYQVIKSLIDKHTFSHYNNLSKSRERWLSRFGQYDHEVSIAKHFI